MNIILVPEEIENCVDIIYGVSHFPGIPRRARQVIENMASSPDDGGSYGKK